MTDTTTPLPLREAIARAIYDRGPGEWTPIDDDDPASEYRRLEAHESITWEMRLRDADAALAVIASRQPTREDMIAVLDDLTADAQAAAMGLGGDDGVVSGRAELIALIDRCLVNGGDDEGQ